jgi:hypothetical protein
MYTSIAELENLIDILRRRGVTQELFDLHERTYNGETALCAEGRLDDEIGGAIFSIYKSAGTDWFWRDSFRPKPYKAERA